VSAPTLEADPACPGAAETSAADDRERDARRSAAASELGVPSPARGLRAERRPFDSIPPDTWDRLAAATPWATPFSSWAFQRAWWDGYGENAHDQTLVVLPAHPTSGAASMDVEPIAIVPLMHRHEVEPSDIATHTSIRHAAGAELTPVPPTAKAIFFGASYHADYATILARPEDLAAVAEAVVDHLCSTGPVDPDHPESWDAVDLRRLRCGDPAAEALAEAFGAREMAEGWILNLEREDVCPVAILPEGGDIDSFLASRGKKERHEIRRKVRRAEAAGDVRYDLSADPLGDLEAFVDLHQRRWGDDGLFPATKGGEQSRVFLRRLFELGSGGVGGHGSETERSRLGVPRLGFLTVGDRRIGAGIHFETADSFLYYNAGLDPDARDLSPGVVMVERLVRRAIAEGKRRFDFLRGDEGYKYEWGAADEPIQRLLVRRRVAG
jgi:hypothetical protein